jgi:hypothetical protein
MKVWATGKGVDKDTQAKATAALAEWEEKRAKTHAKTAAKDAGKTVKATVVDDICDADLLRIVAFTPKCQFSALDLIMMSAEVSDPADDDPDAAIGLRLDRLRRGDVSP